MGSQTTMAFDGACREYAANIGVTFKVPEDVFGCAQLHHRPTRFRLCIL